jgi:hypothetical protein
VKKAVPQHRNVVVPSPGVSIIAVDAGGTTGIAIWDAWDKRLYVDHIDAGRGRKVRYRVMPGIVESPTRRDVDLALCKTEAEREYVRSGGGHGQGRMGELERIVMVEHGVVTILCDLVMALGPRCFVVLEDFVLGATGGVSGARGGLSSPRICHRFADRAWERGLISGDAWRMWQGHGWAGADLRGWSVSGGEVPTFARRLAAVERWRLNGEMDHLSEDLPANARAWAGSGIKLMWNMPAQRTFVRDVAGMKVWMQANGLWVPGLEHGMDALMHVCVLARKLGAEVQTSPERLWEPGAKVDSKRVTAKSTKSA